MLDLEPNFTPKQYEHFHAHWETLIRLVHGGTTKTIQGLYGGTLSKTSKDRSFYLSKKLPDLYHWPTHFPQGKSKNALPSFPGGTLTQHTILPG